MLVLSQGNPKKMLVVLVFYKHHAVFLQRVFLLCVCVVKYQNYFKNPPLAMKTASQYWLANRSAMRVDPAKSKIMARHALVMLD
ncbi:hypothetical protein HC248_00910 [Polaromonas vacuolata]|uniref:Uncharacterized protein n=1 Tax=Polaromonas vacuolata TaxID=37448 RepID=A0A6H2H6Z1_9BURK|nr:hypothetical protein HC248_00910 [Polaromonas vacuolata]